jgi:hypothetical protein
MDYRVPFSLIIKFYDVYQFTDLYHTRNLRKNFGFIFYSYLAEVAHSFGIKCSDFIDTCIYEIPKQILFD